MVRLISYTPLSVCSHAVRTCWQSFGRSDNGGPEDRALIDKVGNKFKHSSILEHLIITWVTSEYDFTVGFREDPFSEVTDGVKPDTWVVSTNVRALQNLQIAPQKLPAILPVCYWYLFNLSDGEKHHVPFLFSVGESSVSLLFHNRLAQLQRYTDDVLSHLTHTFYLQDISRALLQELARHRRASLSVKSTRYTLKELKDEKPFLVAQLKDLSENVVRSMFGTYTKETMQRANKYLVITHDADVDCAAVVTLENLRTLVAVGKPNDRAKFAIPDAYKTELTWSINARSLQNFLRLRTDKAALWEMQRLANTIYRTLPDKHKHLFTEFLYTNKQTEESNHG